ncbi:unnamed protein product [Gordionus sp. m RMFG-2023]|uniref:glycerol-3-phosphate dehydrogenase 1-like protein n=1 Tax=Gordionus sp. m RMFG-2023 TaxID=3053472 RepID=UPI0030E30CDF
MAQIKKVAIIGSGNWGTVIARIIGENVKKHADKFDNTVKMYVYEEVVNNRKLTEILNSDHENVKYLPGYKIPLNVVATPLIDEAVKDADLLIFVMPHQFIRAICKPMVPHVKPSAIGLSLIKGLDFQDGKTLLVTDMIKSSLTSLNMSVLMGANLAPEIAAEKFCETTIGTNNMENGEIFKLLCQTPYFRITVVEDMETVELCGALKNIVAFGAGVIDGLEYGDNTKAAEIRLGLMEMVKFCKMKYPTSSHLKTFFESCGIADLITTCYGGRNRKVGEAFVKTGKKIEELELEMLNGQKLQGPHTALDVYKELEASNLLKEFPIFTGIHLICVGKKEPSYIIETLQEHPKVDVLYDKN